MVVPGSKGLDVLVAHMLRKGWGLDGNSSAANYYFITSVGFNVDRSEIFEDALRGVTLVKTYPPWDRTHRVKTPTIIEQGARMRWLV